MPLPQVDKELISQADLKVVSSMSAGFDHIDLAALKEKKIRLGTSQSCSGSFSLAVNEFPAHSLAVNLHSS